MTTRSAARGPHEFSTHDFTEFRSAVNESFVPLQVRSDQPGRFAGRIRMADLDDIHVSEISAREHWVERTPELIARSQRRYFKLSLQISGSGLLIQDNREALLHRGDMAVYDTGRPYSLIFDDDFRMMVVMFSQTLVDLPIDSIGQLTAVRFPQADGLSGMIGPFLEQMANGIERLSGPTGARLAYSAIDLVTTMFASELDALTWTSSHQAMATKIRAYIEGHLGDPQLDPASIAAAHYISTRHLHGIFREEGTTVSTWIRTRRLEHCRRELVDPLCRDRAIRTIAARWGFLDAAHFSRLFKATFGSSPSELRGE